MSDTPPIKKRGLTKYPRVRERIRRQIAKGGLAPGSRLPTETQFAKRLKVTPPTVSRALNDLVREGLIVRRRGSGSYVADPHKRQVLPGKKVRIGILYSVDVLPSKLWDSFLGLIIETHPNLFP